MESKEKVRETGGKKVYPEREVAAQSTQQKKRWPFTFSCTPFILLPYHSSLTYELIVVDDGSKDRTAEVVLDYSKKYGSDMIRLLKLRRNRGKGGALREVCKFVYPLVVDMKHVSDIMGVFFFYHDDDD